jgi:hypothetical protein
MFGNFADLPGWAQGRSALELEAGQKGFAFRHGIAAWTGEALVAVGRPWQHLDVAGGAPASSQLPPGIYEIEVTRGVEYDMAKQTVDLTAGKGKVNVDFELKRVLDTTGYISLDPHVHHAPESPDSHLEASGQLKIAAVNGLDVMVAANHTQVVDLKELVGRMWDGHDPPLVTIAGVEHEASSAHFGVFPLRRDVSKPGAGAPVVRPWPLEALFADLRALDDKPIVVLYHPRLGWKAYLDAPYCGAWAHKDYAAAPPCPQSYDAIEVLTGWQSCGSRIREGMESWLALLSYNLVAAPMGGSDSHYASSMTAGYPRTWVRVGDDRIAHVSVASVTEAVRRRHTVASSAPFVTVRSGDFAEGDLLTNTGDEVSVSVRVQAPNWVPVDTVRLLVNGAVAKAWTLPADDKAVDFKVTEALALDKLDAFVTVETDSHRPLPPQVVGEYNYIPEYGVSRCPPREGEPAGMPAFATTSPLFIDRDGDGLFKATRAASAIRL